MARVRKLPGGTEAINCGPAPNIDGRIRPNKMFAHIAVDKVSNEDCSIEGGDEWPFQITRH